MFLSFTFTSVHHDNIYRTYKYTTSKKATNINSTYVDMENPDLPTTRAANAVVPEARAASNKQASANAVSVCRKAEATALSISIGKSSSSTMNLGKLLHAKLAASFPPCPSKTCTNQGRFTVAPQ